MAPKSAGSVVPDGRRQALVEPSFEGGGGGEVAGDAEVARDSDDGDAESPSHSSDAGDSAIPRELATYVNPVADAKRWLKDHHVTGPVLGQTCFEVESGVPLAPSLICRAKPADRSDDTIERLYRIDGTKVVQVWKGIVAIYGNWVDLVVEIALDGGRLVVRDRRPCQCQNAQREDEEKRESQVSTRMAESRHRGSVLWPRHLPVVGPSVRRGSPPIGRSARRMLPSSERGLVRRATKRSRARRGPWSPRRTGRCYL